MSASSETETKAAVRLNQLDTYLINHLPHYYENCFDSIFIPVYEDMPAEGALEYQYIDCVLGEQTYGFLTFIQISDLYLDISYLTSTSSVNFIDIWDNRFKNVLGDAGMYMFLRQEQF